MNCSTLLPASIWFKEKPGLAPKIAYRKAGKKFRKRLAANLTNKHEYNVPTFVKIRVIRGKKSNVCGREGEAPADPCA